LHKFCQRGTGPIWPTHLASLLLATESRDQSQGTKQHWLMDVPAELPLLEIDTASLQAIFQELLNNAREATNDKGTLTIQARVKDMTAADCQNTLGSLAPGSCVEITVADDGPGFSAEARAKLFHDLFFTSKPRHRGTGLLVVYGTLLRFKGGLSLDFEQTKPGACVRLFLPIAKLPASAPTSAKPAHVLLVHSDTTLLESMRSVLMSNGLRVSTVSASSAAMSTFQLAKPPFDLVIAETTMPRVSGFELARRILDHHPKAQFVFLSTQSSYHDLAEEEMLKRFVVLRWPIETAEFLKAVDNALTNPAS
jgi:two-component system cell cycle sensor histidine kinase/response regulator CckA